MYKTYLYLASRSKKGIKMICVVSGETPASKRLASIDDLKLPEVWQQKIKNIIQEHKMLYEPWVESANNYQELYQRLVQKGFSNLPGGCYPMINLGHGKIPNANTSSCKIVTTMTRKIIQ